MKPLILVTCSGRTAVGDPQNRRRLELLKAVPDALSRAGAIPLCGCECGSEEETAERMDALFLTGGPDVDPVHFGEEILNDTVSVDSGRDAYELALTRAFAKRGKPVFGVCRGMQVLNIALGGDIWQDLEEQKGLRHIGGVPGNRERLWHPVTAVKGSWLHDLFGERFTVNSMHHQACRRLAEGFSVTCTGAEDGMPEAIRHERMPWMGVQFHPEVMSYSCRDARTPDFAPLFERFVRLVRERTGERS